MYSVLAYIPISSIWSDMESEAPTRTMLATIMNVATAMTHVLIRFSFSDFVSVSIALEDDPLPGLKPGRLCRVSFRRAVVGLPVEADGMALVAVIRVSPTSTDATCEIGARCDDSISMLSS